jgi:ribosomal protein S18 acetylase RimI-like enzyme
VVDAALAGRQAIEVRPAEPEDARKLARIDRATWSWLSSPVPAPGPEAPFFNDRVGVEDVLVAVLDGEVAGYVRLGRVHGIAASEHVLAIHGIAVDPDRQRRGVGRALLRAAAHEARARGARRLTLRVLGPNEGARRLYESAGFVVEGVQSGEFFLAGEYVDDVLMALDLTAAVS